MSKIKVLGVDLAKTVFELCGLDGEGAVVYRKRVKRRGEFLSTVLQLDAGLVCMEACGGANHWGRSLMSQGQAVKLLPTQRVKAFGRGAKNDANDAEAIALAGSQAAIREVAIKTLEQQDIQSLHRVRELAKTQRTATVNQARGLLAEYGIVMPKGIHALRRQVPEILEDADNGVTDRMRGLLAGLFEQYQRLDTQVQQYDREMTALAKQLAVCQRLMAVEGIGPQTATAFYATVGDPAKFSDGRQVAAWLGLVPRQHSSGERTQLLGISKRGDTYLRTLLIHGARSMARYANTMPGKRGAWLRERIDKNGVNKAAVALANKNARLLWALMAHDRQYDCHYQPHNTPQAVAA